MRVKSMRVKEDTYQELVKLMFPQESFDDVINDLIRISPPRQARNRRRGKEGKVCV